MKDYKGFQIYSQDFKDFMETEIISKDLRAFWRLKRYQAVWSFNIFQRISRDFSCFKAILRYFKAFHKISRISIPKNFKDYEIFQRFLGKNSFQNWINKNKNPQRIDNPFLWDGKGFKLYNVVSDAFNIDEYKILLYSKNVINGTFLNRFYF